jgi:hypothetical protein
MNSSGIVLPFAVGVTIITGRSLVAASGSGMPRPYEYGSACVIYGMAGAFMGISPGVGAAVAWAYTIALLLVPSSQHLIGMISGGLQAPAGSANKSQNLPNTGAATA